jgi:hypothetical protein
LFGLPCKYILESISHLLSFLLVLLLEKVRNRTARV